MDSEESTKPERKIEYRVPAAEVPRVYANNLQLGSTSFDVRIVFGEVVDVADAVLVNGRHGSVISPHNTSITPVPPRLAPGLRGGPYSMLRATYHTSIPPGFVRNRWSRSSA